MPRRGTNGSSARDQRFTLAGFFKRIDNPIEAIAFFPAGTDSLQTGFSNAPKADLYGAEVEVQKKFALAPIFGGDFFATKRLLVIANYTYTQSKVKAGTELVAEPAAAGQRRCGAAARRTCCSATARRWSASRTIWSTSSSGIEDTRSLSQFTVLLNYASDRVTNRGPVSAGGGVRLPDLMESPGFRLDLVGAPGLHDPRRRVRGEGRGAQPDRHANTRSSRISAAASAWTSTPTASAGRSRWG